MSFNSSIKHSSISTSESDQNSSVKEISWGLSLQCEFSLKSENMLINPAGIAADSSDSQPLQLFSNEQIAALQQMMQEMICRTMKGMSG